MELQFAGVVIDLSVSDLDRAEAFYAAILGAPADLRPQPDQREWHLLRTPEVALRLNEAPASAGHTSLSLGVEDLSKERERIIGQLGMLPEVVTKPGVIARLCFSDPDGNAIILWQDLLVRRR